MKMKGRVVFIFWGIMDAIYVLWYSFESYRIGKIPYYTDLLSTIDNVSAHGGYAPAALALMSWLLQISIVASAFMLLAGNKRVKLLCYVQIPLRLVSITPSISVLLIAAGYFDEINIIVIVSLLLASEALKGYTLLRRASVIDGLRAV